MLSLTYLREIHSKAAALLPDITNWNAMEYAANKWCPCLIFEVDRPLVENDGFRYVGKRVAVRIERDDAPELYGQFAQTAMGSAMWPTST